jgi:amino acid permease
MNTASFHDLIMKKSIEIISVVAAATIGSGIFALPYVIQESGWLLSLGYFIALIAIVSLAHILYLGTLGEVHEKERLLGLARKYFGTPGFWAGFLAIVVGLLLSFVGYLVIGEQFVHILVPGIPPLFALILFWLIIATLVFKSGGRAAILEVVGISLISCAVFFIFILGHPLRAFAAMPIADAKNIFLPFGAILFSVAGWTSVEQVYEIRKKNTGTTLAFLCFVFGAMLASILYWFFALGILGSVSRATTDTISSVAAWPFWKKDILAIIGLLAIGTVSVPLSREIRGALEKDLGWNSLISRIIIVTLPLVVVLSGFNDFLIIISLAGGIFISAQYILIISVSRRTLQLSRREKVLLDILTVIFICAAIYEIVSFIVH